MAVRLECAKLAGEGLPLGVAYTRFLDLVNRAVAFGHGTLYVTDWTSGRLLPVAVRGNRVELADRVRFARGSGLSAWVAQEGRAVVIPSPGSNGDRSPFADEGLRAFLAFPLVQQGVVAGVLALARTDSTFDEDEFERLGRMAEPLSQTLVQLRREARLRELIYLDTETGLSNRHHFLARVEEELQRARQHASEFAIALVELQVSAGPDRAAVVQAVTQRLQTAMRSCDIVANLGGGQFGMLLAGVNRKKAETIAAGIARGALAAVPTPARALLRMRIGLADSGIVTQMPEELVQQAAAALAEIR
jgi:diguanylate cyclase (GGDEF)-like protein